MYHPRCAAALVVLVGCGVRDFVVGDTSSDTEATGSSSSADTTSTAAESSSTAQDSDAGTGATSQGTETADSATTDHDACGQQEEADCEELDECEWVSESSQCVAAQLYEACESAGDEQECLVIEGCTWEDDDGECEVAPPA